MIEPEKPCVIHFVEPGTTALHPIALDEVCRRCEGTGDDPERKREINVEVSKATAYVSIAVPEPCDNCGGRRFVPTENGRAVGEFIRRHTRIV